MPYQIAAKVEHNLLKPLADDLRPAMENLLRKAAFDIERIAKELVPVDTGNLKNGITPDFDDIRSLAVRVGASAEYGPHVEFGTERARAQPFLTPALEQESPRFIQAVEEVLRRG